MKVELSDNVIVITLPYKDFGQTFRRLQYMKGITFQYAFCTERAVQHLKYNECK